MALTTLNVNKQFPVGSVLQTLQSTKLDDWDSTSTSYVDIPGTDQNGEGSIFCVKITPSSATSKILIIANVAITSDNGGGLTLLRGTEEIYRGDNESGAETARARHSMVALLATASNEIYNGGGNHICFLDSPAATSEQIYKVQGKARTNSFYIGRTVYNLNNDAASRFPSSITAMEIKGA